MKIYKKYVYASTLKKKNLNKIQKLKKRKYEYYE